MRITTVLGVLDREDLARWRLNQAKIKAMEVKPEGYSREEIERAYLEQMQIAGGFVEKYELPNVDWTLHSWTGLIEEGE